MAAGQQLAKQKQPGQSGPATAAACKILDSAAQVYVSRSRRVSWMALSSDVRKRNTSVV